MPVTLAVTFDMSSKDIDQPVHDSAAYVASADERAAAGKALRDKIPRHEHGRWKNSKGRANPIDLLRKSDAGRMKELLAVRYGRMLASPFAFYRGSAGIMASDLARTASTGLKVQACGDCHLMNFGGFVTPERNIIFDMNDFDETSPGAMGVGWIKPLIETFNAEMLNVYSMACGWVLARAHSKVTEISATISGYLGSSNDAFDRAMGTFALAYADQAERDHAALKAAVRKGEITAYQES
jgi:Uncharacterized protein conserved in bacteria (DUF2252)